MIKRYLIIAAAVLTLGIAAWIVRKYGHKKDAAIGCPIIAPDVREKIIVDPRNSKITVITKDRTDTMYLPDRPTAIEIPNKGPVRIVRRTWGFEAAPFAAVVVTDRMLFGIGLDGFYWNKFNFGSGIGVSVAFNAGDRTKNTLRAMDVRAFSHLSYNVYSNTSIGLVLDTTQNIGLDVSFRF